VPRETIDQTKAEIGRLGHKLGIPPENIADAIGKCADDQEIRALRRKWTEKARSLDHQFARKLKVVEEERWAQDAISTHGERLVDEARERRARRQGQSLGTRLDAALVGLHAMSTAGSSWQTGGGGRSSERPAGPPPAEVVDVSAEKTALAILVELLEDRWDAERGLLAPVDYAKMPTADKDRLIARLEGVHSKQIAEMFPWLGGQRTIENRRKEWGLIPSSGRPKQVQEAEAA
jgi:hypothetical protein